MRESEGCTDGMLWCHGYDYLHLYCDHNDGVIKNAVRTNANNALS